MNRTRAAYAILALLAVLAIALSAATLTDTQDVADGGDGPAIEGDEPGVFEEFDQIGGLGWAMYVLAAFVVLIAIGALFGVLRHPLDALTELGRTVVAGLLVVLFVGFLLVLMDGEPIQLADPFGGQDPDSGGGMGGQGDEAIGSEAIDAVAPTGADWTLLVFLLVGAVALGVVGLLANRQLTADGGSETAKEEDALAAIGASAGELADQLETAASVDNEVYRAWKEMTDHLDLDRPEVRAPAEFRDAAVDAGMEPEDVNQLTQLFEEVRYGGAQPTEEREARAVETLRRIERRYATEKSRHAAGERS